MQRHSPGTLNEAVNEEVSSVNPSGSPPPAPPPHVLTSGPPYPQTPPLLQGPSRQLPASPPAPCRQRCGSQGACTARPGCAPTPGCGTKRDQPPAPRACVRPRSSFPSLGRSAPFRRLRAAWLFQEWREAPLAAGLSCQTAGPATDVSLPAPTGRFRGPHARRPQETGTR